MKTLNIDISNTSIASYALDGAYNEVTLSFSGLPESWQAKLVYATFIQDNLNPTLQVIDGSVEVPSEILASNTDFYVGLYAMTEGETQVEEPTTPVLVVVSATESSEIDVEQLIKTIMRLGATINSLSDVAISGKYSDLLGQIILSGSGENSLQTVLAKEAIGDGSVSTGPDAVAGCRGYWIKAMDFTAKKIYLGKSQAYPENLVAGEYDESKYIDPTFETPGYTVGNHIFIRDHFYRLCMDATIESVENNVITYAGTMPMSKLITDKPFSGSNTNSRYSMAVPEEPWIGDMIVGEWSFSGGRETKSFGSLAATFGYLCMAAAYGFACGNGNIAGGSGFAANQGNWALYENSNALGKGNTTADDSQSVRGRYCKPVLGLADVVGGGSESNRKNIYELAWNGTAWFASKLRIGGSGVNDPNAEDVATEAFVKEQMLSDPTVGKWALTSYISGVSAGLRINTDYPIELAYVWRVWLDGKDISDELQADGAFVTAPLIFEDLSKIKLTIEVGGTVVLTLGLKRAFKTDSISAGKLIISEEEA